MALTPEIITDGTAVSVALVCALVVAAVAFHRFISGQFEAIRLGMKEQTSEAELRAERIRSEFISLRLEIGKIRDGQETVWTRDEMRLLALEIARANPTFIMPDIDAIIARNR